MSEKLFRSVAAAMMMPAVACSMEYSQVIVREQELEKLSDPGLIQPVIDEALDDMEEQLVAGQSIELNVLTSGCTVITVPGSGDTSRTYFVPRIASTYIDYETTDDYTASIGINIGYDPETNQLIPVSPAVYLIYKEEDVDGNRLLIGDVEHGNEWLTGNASTYFDLPVERVLLNDDGVMRTESTDEVVMTATAISDSFQDPYTALNSDESPEGCQPRQESPVPT